MKKTITSLVAICAIGVCALAGCNGGGKVGEDFAISNKAELQAEWHVGDANRQIEFTCADEEFNPTALVSSGDITIESSEPEVVGVVGSLLYPLDAGASTITAKYGKHKDTVVIEVAEARGLPYELGKEYYLAEEANGLTYYFTGNIVNSNGKDYDFEGEMSVDVSDAVKVTLSAAPEENGYYMTYTKSSTTYYICIIEKDGYQDLQLTTTANPIYYYQANDAWVNAEASYYLGWHSQYQCLYASSISGINTYQHAYLLDPADASSTGSVILDPVTNLTAGTYYLGIVLDNVQWFFDGSVQSNYYLNLTASKDAAVEVTLTEVSGVTNGWNISFIKNGVEQIFYAYTSNNSSGDHYTVLFNTSNAIPSASGTDPYEVTTTFIWDASINGFTVTFSGTLSGTCTLGLNTSSSYHEITLTTPSAEATPAHLYAI